MATYVTKKCPHCGGTYQFLESGEQRKYGCPCMICLKCGERFWDTDIVEPALHGYENSYETTQSVKRAATLVLYIPLALLMIGVGIWGLKNGNDMGYFFLGFSILLMWVIGTHIKEKIDEDKNWDNILAKRQEDYDKSLERLKDTDYLVALADFDELAEKLLNERINGETEHYARRP